MCSQVIATRPAPHHHNGSRVSERLSPLYQRIARPTPLFSHLFGDASGHLVTFTGQQARFTRPEARVNELTHTRQRYWRYPEQAQNVAAYLLAEGSTERRRDAYFAVHLFREPGSRRADNAVPMVRALWLDEDDGTYPEIGPEPTAIVASSRDRRHLYWQLTEPVSAARAVEMNRRAAVWAGGDTTKAGLASVLRVPGTANFKRHTTVDLVFMELTGAGPWEPEVIDQAIPEAPEPTRNGTRTEPYTGPELELEEFLEGVQVLGEVPDERGVKFSIICPWVAEHSDGDTSGTYIGQRADGGLWFYCNHEHCRARGWRDFRAYIRQRKVRIVRTHGGSSRNKRKVNIYRG
jgi:hypothetical protein